MSDSNEIPFNSTKVVAGEQDYPPHTMLDRYKKAELIEMAHQWCDITEEKLARVRSHLNSGTVSYSQALWYCRVFGRYAGLLPTGPAAGSGKDDV